MRMCRPGSRPQPESTDPVFARRIVDGSVLRVSGGSRAVMIWTRSAVVWCSAVVVAGRLGGQRQWPRKLGGSAWRRSAAAVGGPSGGMRDAAQPSQRHLEGVCPRPAGGQVQPPAARGAGEPPGQHEEGPADGLGDGLLLADAQAERGGPAQQVVGQGGRQQPGRVGVELPGGQVRQPAARLEVADGQLADGVAAVVGVQPGGGAGPVGDEGVVAPGREQLLLVAQVADAADDQPVTSVGVSATCATPPGW